jgi:predicted alpha/beta hydrolase
MSKECPLLVFCFPHRDVGGVPSQFVRLAQHMSRKGIPTAIIDYYDGAMASQIRRTESNIAFIEFIDDTPIDIPAGALLVMQAMTPWTVWRELRGGRKQSCAVMVVSPV